MKKEVVIAIIIGSCLGLLVTFIYYFTAATKNLKDEATFTTPISTTSDKEENTIIQNTSSHQLSLTNPSSSPAVTDESSYQIAGFTSPHSLLAFTNSTQAVSAAADDQGNFALSLDLKPGINQIDVLSYALNGDQASQSATIVYTPLSLNNSSASATNN